MTTNRDSNSGCLKCNRTMCWSAAHEATSYISINHFIESGKGNLLISLSAPTQYYMTLSYVKTKCCLCMMTLQRILSELHTFPSKCVGDSEQCIGIQKSEHSLCASEKRKLAEVKRLKRCLWFEERIFWNNPGSELRKTFVFIVPRSKSLMSLRRVYCCWRHMDVSWSK